MPTPSAPRDGHIYAVGVGPGAGDLLTLRAARILESVDAVYAPRAERAEASMARGCLDGLRLSGAVVECVYPMARDTARTEAFWAAVADDIVQRCEAGQRVAQITIGDPMLYSTSVYLLDALATRLPEDRIHVVPGISAFQAAAARVGFQLLRQEDRLTVMTATDPDAVDAALDHCETLALYKAGRHLPALRALLDRRGLLDRAWIVWYVEVDGKERVLPMRDYAGQAFGYMAAVLIRAGNRAWDEGEAS